MPELIADQNSPSPSAGRGYQKFIRIRALTDEDRARLNHIAELFMARYGIHFDERFDEDFLDAIWDHLFLIGGEDVFSLEKLWLRCMARAFRAPLHERLDVSGGYVGYWSTVSF